MYKDIRVLIVEDDPYARDLMSLLLTRDWRTRVVGEVDSKSALKDFISQPGQNIDLVILDTEIPGEPELPFELADITRNLPSPPVILYTATRADAKVIFRLPGQDNILIANANILIGNSGIDVSNAQGCTQLLADIVDLDNVRFNRCSFVPEPATLTLLAAGAMALLRRKRTV